MYNKKNWSGGVSNPHVAQNHFDGLITNDMKKEVKNPTDRHIQNANIV